MQKQAEISCWTRFLSELSRACGCPSLTYTNPSQKLWLTDVWVCSIFYRDSSRVLWDCWKPCPTEVEGVGVYSLVFKTTQGRTSETFEGTLVLLWPCRVLTILWYQNSWIPLADWHRIGQPRRWDGVFGFRWSDQKELVCRSRQEWLMLQLCYPCLSQAQRNLFVIGLRTIWRC